MLIIAMCHLSGLLINDTFRITMMSEDASSFNVNVLFELDLSKTGALQLNYIMLHGEHHWKYSNF